MKNVIEKNSKIKLPRKCTIRKCINKKFYKYEERNVNVNESQEI